jgi:hypothetical protein
MHERFQQREFFRMVEQFLIQKSVPLNDFGHEVSDRP